MGNTIDQNPNIQLLNVFRININFIIQNGFMRGNFEGIRENKEYMIRAYINFVKVEQHSISIVGQMTG